MEENISEIGLRVRKRYEYKRTRDKYEPVYAFFKRSKEGLTVEKDKIRLLTIDFIHNFFHQHLYTKVKGLTLPGPLWPFEKKMCKTAYTFWKHRMKFSFICCEKDYKLFKLAAANIPKSNKGIRANRFNTELNREVITSGSNICLIYCDIFDCIKSSDKKFDFVWLDVTSTTASVAPKLIGFKNVLNEACVFVLTVLKAREHIKLPCERVEYLTAMMEEMGFLLEKKWEYQDSNSPMLHLIFTR